jgi:hypothetical protein
VLSGDGQSFSAFRRDAHNQLFMIRNDSLISTTSQYDFSGRNADGLTLEAIRAYQEFWHSWKTFHPETQVYKNQ